ncbi:MAG: hypothetical protein J7545_18400 [Roseofilum sp. SBFL]|uniref:hypothetical protein n=1 Tax=unclassified Roseofilum TaxID=2620099 RepID=UPI001B101B08|nr:MULTISPECIES: hypothetical protein [unclassified Roseofilum]MBP0014213.1 hypothetical protein [Roseofilum sp. SID3]MBP0023565.1 hypothetical protein [Roseofilum sp. SID2]MBP0038378.1 hypothetical protein [Roseofilum sp. SID1]MBP0043921.1 hypothetical protein [Roseofilum sp. SBFL]
MHILLSPVTVATDVVAILYPGSGHKNRTTYVKNIPSEWKGNTKVMTPGGIQLAGVCWLFFSDHAGSMRVN